MSGRANWNDALEKRFLLEIVDRVGASSTVMKEIAEKWGAPHTVGSLGMKLARLRKSYAEQNGGEVPKGAASAAGGAKAKKNHPPKRKADTPVESSEDDEQLEKKTKKVKVSKDNNVAGDVKLEQDLDEF